MAETEAAAEAAPPAAEAAPPAAEPAETPDEEAWRENTLSVLENDEDIKAQFHSGALTVRILHAAVAAALGVEVDKESKAVVKATLVKRLTV